MGKFKGVVFDLDGVITKTADIHATAWKEMFDDFLKNEAKKTKTKFIPFDSKKDYLDYVDGKPRGKGVSSFLKSRGIELPEGKIDDTPEKRTINGLGNKKNVQFQKVLNEKGPTVFKSSIQLVKKLIKNGVKVGIASSSKNCQLILQLGKIEHLFETRVDGVVSLKLDLKGKPEPDIFIVAAKNMGLKPDECVVVEDAISGVQAGRAGNFALTLGIAREIDGNILKANGADIVIKDLSEITLFDIQEWFEKKIHIDSWSITYNDFNPKEEKLRETLCSIGNGYLGSRGCFEGEKASDSHYPGTYIAGFYNKIATKIHNRLIYNNDLVNIPNWLLIKFKIGEEEFVSPLKNEILSYTQTLNLKLGTMMRIIVVKDKANRITRIESTRFASMAQPHLCAIKYKLTPVNYSGNLTLSAGLDGNIINSGVDRYKDLSSKHLEGIQKGSTKNGIFLYMKTNGVYPYKVAMSSKVSLSTMVAGNAHPVKHLKTIFENKWEIACNISFQAKENTTYELEKFVSIYTSLDQAIVNPLVNSKKLIKNTDTYNKAYNSHIKAWEKIWDKADINIKTDRFIQKIIRLHIYHVLIAACEHNKNIDAGMTARGLTGEAYRGHVFWDEIYIFPYYNLHFPKITKSLLKYRYKRLDAARTYAKDNNYMGAMYPWQTADDGSEETQEVHYNPKSGDWGPDLSRQQRHVSIAIFYNICKYVSDTNDNKFLEKYGLEMMLEIARFWASIAYFDKESKKYHIKNVMGPDEFHEALPDSDETGVKDNSYTNIMVVWVMQKALLAINSIDIKILKKIKAKIKLKNKELDKWQDMTSKMNIPFFKDKEIISQFSGYENLKELDWESYRAKYGDIHRMDRILKAEGKSPDDYKVAKQPDVLMMFYILSVDEILSILKNLGIDIADKKNFLKNHYEYYVNRTSHGSTLSKVVHSVICSYLDIEGSAWEWFTESMKSDIYDTQGGTTKEGIHCGVMAGTLDLIIRFFAGITFGNINFDNTTKSYMHINPHLPYHWKEMNFKLRYKKIWYNFMLTKNNIKIAVQNYKQSPAMVKIKGKTIDWQNGKIDFDIN